MKSNFISSDLKKECERRLTRKITYDQSVRSSLAPSETSDLNEIQSIEAKLNENANNIRFQNETIQKKLMKTLGTTRHEIKLNNLLEDEPKFSDFAITKVLTPRQTQKQINMIKAVAQKQKKLLLQKLANLDSDYIELEQELHMKNQHEMQLQEKMRWKDKRIEELQEKLREAEKRVFQASQLGVGANGMSHMYQLQELRYENQQLKRINTDLEEEVISAKRELEKCGGGLKRKEQEYTKLKYDSELEIDGLRREIEALKHLSEKEVEVAQLKENELEEAKAKFEAEADRVKAKTKEVERLKLAMKKKIENMHTENGSVRMKLVKTRGVLKELRSIEKQMQKAAKGLHSKLKKSDDREINKRMHVLQENGKKLSQIVGDLNALYRVSKQQDAKDANRRNNKK